MYFKIIKELNSYYLFFKNFKLIYLNKNFIEVFKKLKVKKVYLTKNELGEFKLLFNRPIKILSLKNKNIKYYDYKQEYLNNLTIIENNIIQINLPNNNNVFSLKQKDIQNIFKFKNLTIREFNIYLI